MKKTILIAVVTLFVLVFAAVMVNANAPAAKFPPCVWNQTNLTDAQKQELTPIYNQMTDLRKQMFELQKQAIQKQVSFGNLTQEQADQRIAWLQQRIDQGFGCPGLRGGGPGRMGRGPGFGPMWQQQQPAAK